MLPLGYEYHEIRKCFLTFLLMPSPMALCRYMCFEYIYVEIQFPLKSTQVGVMSCNRENTTRQASGQK